MLIGVRFYFVGISHPHQLLYSKHFLSILFSSIMSKTLFGVSITSFIIIIIIIFTQPFASAAGHRTRSLFTIVVSLGLLESSCLLFFLSRQSIQWSSLTFFHISRSHSSNRLVHLSAQVLAMSHIQLRNTVVILSYLVSEASSVEHPLRDVQLQMCICRFQCESLRFVCFYMQNAPVINFGLKIH